jgi:preprotein translocase subunit YajC
MNSPSGQDASPKWSSQSVKFDFSTLMNAEEHEEERNQATETFSEFEYVADEDEIGNYNFDNDDECSSDDYTLDTAVNTSSIAVVSNLAHDVFANTVHDSVNDERLQAERKLKREMKRKAASQRDNNHTDNVDSHKSTESAEDDSDILINRYGKKKKKNTIMENINTISANIVSSTNNYIHKINPIKTTLVTTRETDDDDTDNDMEDIELSIVEIPRTPISRSPTTPTRLTPLSLFPIIRASTDPIKRGSKDIRTASRPTLNNSPDEVDFMDIIVKDEEQRKAFEKQRTKSKSPQPNENGANLSRNDSSNQILLTKPEATAARVEEITIVVEDENGTLDKKIDMFNNVDQEPIERRLSFHIELNPEAAQLPCKCGKKGFILQIPDDTLQNVIRFLNPNDSATISLNLTCKSWYHASINDTLWRDQYLTFINNKANQKHSGLLTYVREFTTPHKSEFRTHLINARKLRHRFKIRSLAEDSHSTLRKYLFLNSLVLAPFVFMMCLIASTILAGAFADGYLNQGVYMFIPQFFAMNMSIQGTISFLLRETILFRHGFYDRIHLFNFLVLSFMPLTFYICLVVIIFKAFITRSVPWTVHMIPCLVIYILYCVMTLSVLMRRYSKRRREFRHIIAELKQNSLLLEQDNGDLQVQREKRKKLEEAQAKLVEWQRHRVYTRSRYVVQPESERYADFSDEDDYSSSSSETTITHSSSTSDEQSDDATEQTEEQQADEKTQQMVSRIQRNDDVSVIMLYSCVGFSVLCIALEIIVLPLRIDGYTSASWAACLIPLWLLLATLMLGTPTFLAWQLLTDTGMTELIYSFDPRYAKQGKRRKSKRIVRRTNVIGGLRWERVRRVFASTTQHNYDNQDDETEKDVGFCAFSVVPICLFAPGIVALGLITASLQGNEIPMLAGCSVLAFWEFLLGGFFIIFALPFALSRNTGF